MYGLTQQNISIYFINYSQIFNTSNITTIQLQQYLPSPSTKFLSIILSPQIGFIIPISLQQPLPSINNNLKCKMHTHFYPKQTQYFHNYHSSTQKKTLIQSTQQQYKDLIYQTRLEFAREHFQDALYHRLPRINIKSMEYRSCWDQLLENGYQLQSSQHWRKFFLALSYIFMYVVIVSHTKPGTFQLYLEVSALCFLWVDLILQFLHRNFLTSRKPSISIRFYIKFLIIFTLTGDEVIVLISQDIIFRPFIFLRASLPFFFNQQLYKYFQSIVLLYKDIFVYIIFYSLVLVFFGIMANQFIQLPDNIQYDEFTQNYQRVSNSMFLFYVMSTYDSFPDNQILAIQECPIMAAIFVSFIFFNILIFSTVPSSQLFKSFRQYHSKTIIIDQIRQQHSLIMAFIALNQNQQLKLPQSKFLVFLFQVYKKRIRYIDCIIQICLKLNTRKSKYIEIYQFIKLCKIIQSNSRMLPPIFNQCQVWANIRQKINDTIKLKYLIQNTKFDILIALMILLSIINSVLTFYYETLLFYLLDTVFICIFGLEMVLKILCFGFRNFFTQSQNIYDFLIIVTIITLQLINSNILPPHIKTVLMLLRFYKLPLLAKQFAQKRAYILKNQIYIKTARLINQILITFPIVLSFFPVFAIIAYFLGTLGMTIFSGGPKMQPEESPYSRYNDYSNFDTLFKSQAILVQVLIQAGWSFLVFDYAYRYNTSLSFTYFIGCHLLISFLLTSLIKGIIWQIYTTVHNELNLNLLTTIKKQSQTSTLSTQRQQLTQLSNNIQYHKVINPTTILSRKIMERNIDGEIFSILGNLNTKICNNNDKQQQYWVKNIGSVNYLVDQIDQFQYKQNQEETEYLILQKLNNEQQIQIIQDIHPQDIQNYITILSKKLKINLNHYYQISIKYPLSLQNHLKNKLTIVYSNNTLHNKNNTTNNIINTNQTISIIKSQLKSLIMVKKMRTRQLINHIVLDIKQSGINIDTQKVLQSYQDKTNHPINTQQILRKAFLSDTNQQLIKKFQCKYFHHVYPQVFAHSHSASNIILNPFLIQQSKLTYCLRNILRYNNPKTTQFFHHLTTIQSKITTKLLKKGSLFKFIFKLTKPSEKWFTIQSLTSQQISLHFLKNGTWLAYPFIQQLNIYFGKDIFDIRTTTYTTNDIQTNTKLIKQLYNSFQTIALNTKNPQYFFSSDPSYQTHDLYLLTKTIQPKTNNLTITQLMVVLLSNEGDRNQPLDYLLTNMQISTNKNYNMFKFDQTQKQTLDKLKKLELTDEQLMDQSSGIPFQFIVNFMIEIKDIITNYSQNLVIQIEKVLNNKSTLLSSNLHKL